MTFATHKRALITGASSGIGKATALAFAEAGIHLALVSRSASKLEAVVAQAQALGVEAKAYPLDLAEVGQVKDRIAAIATEFGPIDILVNNAGIGYTGMLMETSLADWQSVLDINLTSVFQCIQGVIPSMRDRASGTIINVASIAAQNAFPNWGAYSVSKAGLVMLSKILAAEERSHGIRTICISPGSVNTPIWDTDTVQADFNRNAMLTPEVVAQTILHAAQLPASAVVEELTLLSNAGVL
ncbi:SDR family oxidoreductase [Desertifilum sp. FACHB-1129]|uniref:Short-chain dehydrogenase n=1 Tax=Desertifilum tharense IPPAS B-1220 TaxID=1781255 RepID=A0A1E5QQP7_9CYAN|nr:MULTISPECIES: SDR family oxidoreductase [Desertifilum]MDA0212463.1 SDR family oxidoreductase [Cyanobacteria bacterium FC1]MBD2313858.1 SDR family oxidoreductase [Desertifilum sp. FACHB-1129]MBD2323235.1 SDR family oxidoreductase [Desertifilum sp. FACHB-866]MBD2333080.1 SDR family oxidoreductase [Desertifilum sp. FACHB-868]OEJ76917.1 short-chain dehydrogenase [Desertifilum tharense IPPAS B-1220]